ncbi:hypothetical protein ACJMK2_033326 [Sinanodonta woodiana]|uniref:DBB domain-containing protein n=1 Tax=Sinanodonta woodiana TaxID=1069815 RepID=A0ABD3WQ40_SINWO
MSGDIIHNIFYQFDGETCARRLKDFFSGRKYNVQFNLHELQNAYSTIPRNLGVSILLFTPHSHAFIKSGKHADLNAIFPNPELSVVLVVGLEKTKDELSTLSSRIKDFHKWKILEYQNDGSLNKIDKDIMILVERSEGFQQSPSLQRFRVWNCERVKSNEEMLLIFTKAVENDPQVKVIQEWDSQEKMAQRLNSMIYSFTVGDVEPGERIIEVLVNGASFGRSTLHVPCVKSKMEELSELLYDIVNPIELLCQCLQVVPSSRDNLDRWLHDLLCNNTSSVSHIFDKLNWEIFGESNSNYELPTLLHFGAKYGLRRFCLELLRHPGGIHAQTMKNKDGLRPDQIAQKERFDDLAMDLRTGMNEPKSMETLQSQLRRKNAKAPLYVHTPQSPFGGKADVVIRNYPHLGVERNVSDTNIRPQPCTTYQTQSYKSSKSSTSYIQSVSQQSNDHGSPSVRSSSDSGLGEEIPIKTTVRELGRRPPYTRSTREDANLPTESESEQAVTYEALNKKKPKEKPKFVLTYEQFTTKPNAHPSTRSKRNVEIHNILDHLRTMEEINAYDRDC